MDGCLTRRRAVLPDAVAPDGAAVHLLAVSGRGSMAVFTLPAGAVSRPVVHCSVEELWYILAGRGRMWRCADGREEVTELHAGVSVAIAAGTRFQFRCDGGVPLEAVAVTMPPWPGAAEAEPADGVWPPTL